MRPPLDDNARFSWLCDDCQDTGRADCLGCGGRGCVACDNEGDVDCECERGQRMAESMAEALRRGCDWCGAPALEYGSIPRCAEHDGGAA